MSDNAPDQPDETTAREVGADWAVPIFRTVTTPTGRHALRLEAVFWDAIARMAKRQNRKPTDLLRELLGQAKEEAGTNLSSALRSSIVRLLLVEDERLSVMATPIAVVQLMQLAPTPSFALDRNKRLVRVNDEFVRYLKSVLAKAGPVEKAQLRLDRPTEQLFNEVAPGTAVECGVSIQVDNHERRTQAKIVIPPPGPADILVGFIVT